MPCVWSVELGTLRIVLKEKKCLALWAERIGLKSVQVGSVSGSQAMEFPTQAPCPLV